MVCECGTNVPFPEWHVIEWVSMVTIGVNIHLSNLEILHHFQGFWITFKDTFPRCGAYRAPTMLPGGFSTRSPLSRDPSRRWCWNILFKTFWNLNKGIHICTMYIFVLISEFVFLLDESSAKAVCVAKVGVISAVDSKYTKNLFFFIFLIATWILWIT